MEQAIAEKLALAVGPPYTVKLADARSGLASNGGIHCVFGTIRRPRGN